VIWKAWLGDQEILVQRIAVVSILQVLVVYFGKQFCSEQQESVQEEEEEEEGFGIGF
jgi:hypothetical protein